MQLDSRPSVWPALALAFVAYISLPGSAQAAQRWIPTGPEGGSVIALAFDASGPHVRYAALDEGGVWRSEDGGASWVSANDGLPPATNRTLVADPVTPGALFLGRSVDGIWKSADGGRSWSSLVAALDGRPAHVQVLRFDPASHALFAGLQPEGGQASLYRSTDGGAHWTAIDLGIAGAQVTTLLFADGDLYVGTAGQGLFRGSSSGTSWVPSLTGASVNGLAFAGGSLYATSAAGLAVSHDRGATFTTLFAAPISIPGRPPNHLFLGEVAVSPADLSRIFVAFEVQLGLAPAVRGLYSSSDGGATFGVVSGGFPAVRPRVLVFEPGSGRLLAAPGGLGVWASADGQTGWTKENRGMWAAPVFKVLADPKRPAVLFASVGDVGTMRSDNAGLTWKTVTGAATVDLPLALDPEQPATVYALGHDLFGQAALYKSANAGRVWTRLDAGDGSSVYDLALDPLQPRRLYAAQPFNGGAIARSSDGGATWSTSHPDCLLPFHLAVASSGEVYAGGSSPCGAAGEVEGGVYRSDDGGRTFVNRRTGLPSIPVVSALAVHPARPTNLFLGLSTAPVGAPSTVTWGVFRSTDRADHWHAVPGLFPLGARPTDFAFAPAAPATVWLATDGLGVWRSGDGGGTFRPVGTPGLPTQEAFDLELDRQKPATVYVATPGGLFRLGSDAN